MISNDREIISWQVEYYMETVYVIANTLVKVKVLKLQVDIFVISDLIYYLFIQPNRFLNAYHDISDVSGTTMMKDGLHRACSLVK